MYPLLKENMLDNQLTRQNSKAHCTTTATQEPIPTLSEPTPGTSQLSPEDTEITRLPMVTQPILCFINRREKEL
ncbi:hypothetical protein GIB67_000452 [Kingdonia uniflora]|uniref:Uncharacterized protein n=1 Tax=Kingdonia uniflora TaxID=39325 RepID=A0A7J7L0D7_9MAGN|nr:hypothetical protein GIB67_000452 [Kingdonia uniflora]